ncbi:MAG: SWIB/MDM2 domain-containing protein [candidate division WOR-3 bacterium]|jgi:chromatin remodeling complex protein RSC6
MPRGQALMNRTVKLTEAMQPIFGPGKQIKVRDINKKLWAYIKKHKLMSGEGPLMKRTITLTPEMQAIMGKKTAVKVGEMNKLLWKYINANNLF